MKKIKVLQIITHLGRPNGAADVVLKICRLCDHSKFDNHILYGSLASGHQTLEEVARQNGVTLHALPSLRQPIQPVSDSRAYREMVAFLKRGKYDVVHTHSSKAGVIGRMAAAAARVPVILHTVHGWGHHDYQHPLVRSLYIAAEKKAARVTDRLIVVANANSERGLRDGIGRAEQYQTVWPGIDIAQFRDVVVDGDAVRRELGIPEEALVVGTVGRLARQKAPGDFVRMAAAIHAQRPDVHFVYIGGGPLHQQFRKAVEKAGLSERLHHLGDRPDVPRLLRALDVFTLTSLWEGLPVVFAQAMCARLPIVATRVDGTAEAVDDGVSGFLVPPRSPELQAERVLTLLNDAPRRLAMGQRGFESVYPKFCELLMVQRVEEIYTEYAHKKNLLPASLVPHPFSLAHKGAKEVSPV